MGGCLLVGLGLVLLVPCLAWSMCPFAVAMERGGCRLKLLALSPGKPVMKLLPKAFCSVDRVGLKRAAWLKATCSATVGSWWEALATMVSGGRLVSWLVTGLMVIAAAVWCGDICLNPGGGDMGMCHSPVMGVL